MNITQKQKIKLKALNMIYSVKAQQSFKINNPLGIIHAHSSLIKCIPQMLNINWLLNVKYYNTPKVQTIPI